MSNEGEGVERALKKSVNVIRTKEGGLDFKPYWVASEMGEALSNVPGFVGAAPFGSTTLGYADEDSDIDLAVFCNLDEFKKSGNTVMSFDLGMVGGTATKLSEQVGRKIECVTLDISDSIIKSNISRLETNEYKGSLLWVYLCMSYATGPKIEEYREKIANAIRELPTERQSTLIERIAGFTVTAEMTRLHKLQQRIPSFIKTDMVNFSNDRREVWKQQIKQALNLSP